MQEGVPFRRALWDAFLTGTASITVMEVVALGVDPWLAGDTTLGEPLLWAALVTSLSMGLIAAYPVNVLLIAFGVEEGLHDPREMADHGGHQPSVARHPPATAAGVVLA